VSLLALRFYERHKHASASRPRRGAFYQPKLSDPAHGTRGLQPERDGRVRCSA